jgi:hypothetical protein
VLDRKPDYARPPAFCVRLRKTFGPGSPRTRFTILILLVAALMVVSGWDPARGSSSTSKIPARNPTPVTSILPASDVRPAAAPPTTWTEVLPEGLPPSNLTTTPVLVYDPSTLQTLDFASASGGALTGIWSYTAGVWTNVTPSGNLTHQDLTEFSVTFDAAGDYVLLFGYVAYQSQYPDRPETWTYAADTWTELNLTPQPQGQLMAGVTYDPILSSVILLTAEFGDSNGMTWSFNGSRWTLLSPTSSPPGLFGSTMVFDNSTPDQEIVLFADGISPGGPVTGFWNQTWVYRGSQWINVTAASGPDPPAGEGAMTYDPGARSVLLVDGGYSSNHTPMFTWQFANGTWNYLPTPSTAPFLGEGGGNLVYDGRDGSTLFVGNYSSAYTGNTTTQTWMYAATNIGPPPVLTLTVTPQNVTNGGKVRVSAAETGGYGALAYEVRIEIPGCYEVERQAGAWECTTTGSGPGVVGFQVTDQAGRVVTALASVEIASPPSSSPLTLWLYYVLGSAIVVTALGVVFARDAKRHPKARSPEEPTPPSPAPDDVPP